jgi:hypothetical protein
MRDAVIFGGGDKESRLLSAETETDLTKLIGMAEVLTAAVDTPEAAILVPTLVQNLNLPFDLAFRLAGSYYGVHDLGYELSSRPDATAQALDELLYEECGNYVAEAIVKHPNVRLSTLKSLLTYDNDYTDAIATALTNPKVSSAIVESWAHDPDPKVRTGLARTVSSPVILKDFAADEDINVRFEAVRNPHTPAETINHVASADPDKSVVAAAAARATVYRVLDTLAESLMVDPSQEFSAALLQNQNSSPLAKTIAVLIYGPNP